MSKPDLFVLVKQKMRNNSISKSLVVIWFPSFSQYLGVPIQHRKLRNSEWNSPGNWQGKLFSYGDRLVLINSVLTSMPFMLSFLKIPRGEKKARLFPVKIIWQNDDTKKKYRLTSGV
jgi:hypothetical protein